MDKKYLVIKKSEYTKEDFQDMVVAAYPTLNEAYGAWHKLGIGAYYIAKIITVKAVEE